MPASLRYLERLWGTAETIKFIIINIVVANVISFIISWIEFIAFGYAETFLYVVPSDLNLTFGSLPVFQGMGWNIEVKWPCRPRF